MFVIFKAEWDKMGVNYDWAAVGEFHSFDDAMDEAQRLFAASHEDSRFRLEFRGSIG